MLSTKLQPNYTVANLVNDLENWIEEGYVNEAVWEALQKDVSADVLPTLPKKRRLDEASQSSDQPLSNSGSAATLGSSASFEAEDITFTMPGIKMFPFAFGISRNTESLLCT